jgi:shikimate 5-dehydrogenase
MYFIGVSTSRSLIMRVFPAWAEHLQLGPCTLRGVDLALHDAPERYRQVVEFIRDDPLSLGALVTTHKIDLFLAARDLFDGLDPAAETLGELSSISKRGGRLLGAARDAVTGGRALSAFLPAGHWERSGADAFLMGAGGSAIALSCFLAARERGADRPRRIIVSNRSSARLERLRAIHRQLGVNIPVDYVLAGSTGENDAVLGGLPPGSLAANATGLGKDAPGSPLSDNACFPPRSYAWDFNYRGELVFLSQARRQAPGQGLVIEDGWRYFIHGWLAVIADVFGRDLPSSGPAFDELAAIAERERSREAGG